MTYLLAINYLSTVAALWVYNAFAEVTSGKMAKRDFLSNSVPLVVSTLLINAVLVMEAMHALQYAGGMPLPVESLLPDVLLTGAGAMIGMLVYGLRLHRQRGTQPRPLAILVNAFGLAASLYLSVVVIDHELFYRDEANAGMVNLEYFRDSGGVKDVGCGQALIVARGVDDGDVVYRCPEFMLYGKFSSKPFIPWPSYTEGTSPQLGLALRRVNSRAEKL